MKRIGLVLSLLLLAGAPAAIAQPGAPEGTPKREGEYGGVDPDGTGTPAPAPEAKGKKVKPPPKKTLTWVGFTAKADGASELFFQAATPFTVEQRLEGNTLIVLLAGLPKQARNTRRPLDTRFFDTSLLRVTARPARKVRARKGQPARPAGIEIRIAFKDPKDAKEGLLRTDTGKDGMAYAYLGFGAPSAPRKDPNAGSGGTMDEPE